MGKRMLMGLLAVLTCATAVGAQTGTLRVTAERTSVRETPAADAAVTATVVKGEELDVLETTGAWYRVRVRSTSREGFVHNLFVERTPGSAPAAPAVQGAPATGQTNTARPAAAVQPMPIGTAVNTPLDERQMGVGLTTGGLAFGFTPSLRYWASGKTGFEVNASFVDTIGGSVTALSPSLLMRFSEVKQSGSIRFAPYWGAGITYWRYSNDFFSYCDITGVDCSDSSIGFGGFGGGEVLFEKLPKLAVSGSLGYYTSPGALGYGGLYLSVAGHWYFR